jgi:ribosomal-protein-alanine N-acetyltransferase
MSDVMATKETSIPTITTRRLVLRAFTEQDAKPLYRILGQDGVLRYFPNSNPPSLERVQNLVARQLAHWKEYGYGWWAVVPRTEQTCIGWAGLQFLPEMNETEVAFLLSKDHWGQGLATEAALASVQHGFETLGLARIVGIVHVENGASRRVLKKLGMSLLDQTTLWGMECYRYSVARVSFLGRSASGQVDYHEAIGSETPSPGH